MKKQLKSISMLVVTGLCVATMVSCHDTDYPAASPSTAGYNTASSKAIIVNASNAASITALFENIAAGTALTPDAYTGYIGVPLGSDQVRIKGSGGTLTTNDFAAKLTFLTNTSYTVFVTDTITRPSVKSAAGTITDVGGVRLLQVADTLTAPAAGTAKFRLFNLSPDVTGVISSTVAAPISARVLNSAGTVVATLNNRAYRIATGATLRYTVVPADTYTVQVYSATAVPGDLAATPLASTTVALADGKIYSLYTKGLRRNNTLSVGTVQHN